MSFDASMSTDENGIATFAWTFSDTTQKTLNGKNPTYTFHTPGVYTVTLNVTDNAGNWATDTMSITVLDITEPVANAGHDQTVPAGFTVTFDARGSSDNVGVISYEWNFGDGTEGAGITTTHTYSSPGVYRVTLTVKDAANNIAKHSITVTVLAEKKDTQGFPIWILGAAVVAILMAIAIITLVRRQR